MNRKLDFNEFVHSITLNHPASVLFSQTPYLYVQQQNKNIKSSFKDIYAKKKQKNNYTVGLQLSIGFPELSKKKKVFYTIVNADIKL